MFPPSHIGGVSEVWVVYKGLPLMGLHSDKWVEKWVKPTRAPSRAEPSRELANGRV
ncbi:hypothetical protein HanIR_Chr14g0706881 [Helianthus annuus]|nr:hypothetical protein HanIR_Chr14g0706881 [Helianthus annuus]